MIVKDEITADYIGIQCDVCETMAPDAEAIREGHGLNNMGWLCSGGSHLCPSHAPAKPLPSIVPTKAEVTREVTAEMREAWVNFDPGGAAPPLNSKQIEWMQASFYHGWIAAAQHYGKDWWE